MRRCILVVCLLLLPLLLGGWVDPDTIDVYTGYAVKADNSYDVSDLSGTVQYYLTGYDGFCLDSNGYLFNSSSTSRTGICRTSAGYELECRMNARSGFQIQQTYYSSGIARTAWISYNLVPDLLPSALTLAELALIVITVIVFIVSAILIISRGAIL